MPVLAIVLLSAILFMMRFAANYPLRGAWMRMMHVHWPMARWSPKVAWISQPLMPRLKAINLPLNLWKPHVAKPGPVAIFLQHQHL
ncbi:hypothetical protein D3C72_2254780 [compost metagenome]